MGTYPYDRIMTRKKAKPDRIDWKNVISVKILDALKNNPKDRFPTIRSVWYYLFSALQVIPGTESTYKKVDDLLVNMRKDGDIEFGRFEVARGESGSGGNTNIEPVLYVENRIEWLLSLANDYELPRLHNQPYLIEVWVEKKGLIRSFEKICSPLGVKVRSPEGFTPWEFTYSVLDDLDDYFDERQSRHLKVLYFGDQDPSGLSIYDSLVSQLNYFDVDFESFRVGVTIEQIRDFKLPETPLDVDTLAKIRRDSRYPKYVERFGDVFCELDALISLAYDDFRSLVEFNLDNLIHTDIIKDRDIKNAEIKQLIKSAIDPEREALIEIKDRIIDRLNGFPESIQ